MFSLPIPFIEKGALKTVDIQKGYAVDCSCVDSGGASGSTMSNALLQSILTELQFQNVDMEQTMFTTNVDGFIPAGVQSYTIINLGVTPNNPAGVINSMTVDGVELNSRYITFGNTTDTHNVLVNPVPYITNGNTLAIIYNTPA